MRDRILEDDIIRTALSLTWPILLSNTFQTVYNLTDAFWLGRLGPEAVAAPSVSWPIIFLLIAMGAGFGVAGITMVSQYTGAGDRDGANKTSGQLILILLLASLTVAITGFTFTGAIL